MAKEKKQVLPVRELYKFKEDEIKEGLRTNLSILFEDGVVKDLTYREITLLRFIMEVYKPIPEIAIVSKHCFTNFYSDNALTSKTINRSLSAIVEDAVRHYVMEKGYPRKFLDAFAKQAYLVINNIYNNLTYKSQEYISSLNIIDLLEVQLKPELMEAISNVYKTKYNVPSYVSADNITKTYQVLNKIMWKDKTVENNPIAIGYRTGTMNANQIKQVLGSRGFTTELDSSIFKVPVAGSFTLGLLDMYEMTIESRSGAKSLFLSNKAIQDSEYFAREMQLVTMPVEKLVDGDCGSKKYLTWTVNESEDGKQSDLDNLLGKYYLNPDTGEEEEITAKHKHLIGRTIQLRSSLYCTLPDPGAVCMKCFGTLGYAVPAHSNIGHYCSTTVTEKLSQAILSTKHLTSSANSGEVKLDEIGHMFFDIKNNNFFLKEEIYKKYDKLELVINQREFFGIRDLKQLDNIDNVNITRLSRIRNIVIRTITDKKIDEYNIKIAFTKTSGSFTHAFIRYVKNCDYYLDNSNNYVIDITNWKYKNPFILMPIVEFNFSELSKSVKGVIRQIKINKKTGFSVSTPELLLQSLFEMLNTKLTINISILEIMVYALTFKDANKGDYTLGRNIDNPQLNSSLGILSNRSLGAGYGWQNLLTLIFGPRAFFKEYNMDHPLDVMIKPNETVGIRRYNEKRYDK